MEISDIRRRLRQTIEGVRRATAERRARADAAAADYQVFLARIATPVFKMFANALTVEGYPFRVFTPANGLRLMSERSSDDYIELLLDTSTDPPVAAARINRGRGHRLVTTERSLREGVEVAAVTEADVIDFLFEEIPPFVER
jgi:hypothetical protein